MALPTPEITKKPTPGRVKDNVLNRVIPSLIVGEGLIIRGGVGKFGIF